MININTLFVSVFGVGFIPIASGTFGSLAGIIIGYILYYINNNLLYFAIPVLFIFGVLCANIYQKQTGEKDSSVIVIDEVVGQLIAMSFIINNPLLVFISFILFRIFDIFKPWPASYADRKIKGGLGVMLDDVVAGIYALISLFLIGLIF
jgi:phosphatidylglycerophosphatase A